MGSAFALIGLGLKYGPLFVQIVRMLAPVLKEAGPVFQQLQGQGVPADQAAQKAVAVAAPYITTPPELRGSDPTYDRMIAPN
jgi:hypothetical protein